MTQTDRIRQSPNFREGAFQNPVPTRMMADDASYWRILKGFIFKPADVMPPAALPHLETDLKALHPEVPAIVWFGHSSYLIIANGMRILVDPVFSGNAGPLSFMVKAFAGSNTYSVADLPDPDVVIITHNHYDHLDKKTITQLKDRVPAFYTALGADKDLTCFGVPVDRITALDWWEEATVAPGVKLTATPARHFSGRGLKRNGSLWASFVLQLPGYRLFLGGDSGYGPHFKTIGDQFGPFDLALLECGQYNMLWPDIHMLPEEVVQAAIDLKAACLMPVHWGKFALGHHPWNEPVKRVVKRAAEMQVNITTPLIGEPVLLGGPYPVKAWWNL